MLLVTKAGGFRLIAIVRHMRHVNGLKDARKYFYAISVRCFFVRWLSLQWPQLVDP